MVHYTDYKNSKSTSLLFLNDSVITSINLESQVQGAEPAEPRRDLLIYVIHDVFETFYFWKDSIIVENTMDLFWYIF